MDLARITNQPVDITIAGKTYQFRELDFNALGRLQQWLKDHTPHPIRELLPYLEGTSDHDRAILLEGARKDALKWPPKIGTAAGSQELLGTEDGQKAAFLEALRACQPATTREESDRLYSKVLFDAAAAANARKKGAAEPPEHPAMTRIFAIAFGQEDAISAGGDGGGDSLFPKDRAAATSTTR